MVLGALAVAFGVVVVYPAVAPSSWPGSGRSPSEYFFRFPDRAASPPTRQLGGGATLVIRTNLPEGTLLVVGFQTGDRSSGFEMGQSVHQGMASIDVANIHCHNAFAQEPPGFAVTVATAPVLNSSFISEAVHSARECLPPGSNCDASQPASVLAALGPHFERLTGDQVTTFEGANVIIVRSGSYQWPAGNCLRGHSQTHIPTCPPQRSIFPIESRRPEWFASRIAAVGNEWKPCLVWASASKEFQAANPWPAFRDRFTVWLDGMGRSKGDFPEGHLLSSSTESFPYKDSMLPQEFSLELVRGGTRVATASFLHIPGPTGELGTYELTTLELIG